MANNRMYLVHKETGDKILLCNRSSTISWRLIPKSRNGGIRISSWSSK